MKAATVAAALAAALLPAAALAESACYGNDVTNGDCGCAINLTGGKSLGWNWGKARNDWRVNIEYTGDKTWDEQEKFFQSAFGGLDGKFRSKRRRKGRLEPSRHHFEEHPPSPFEETLETKKHEIR